MKRGRPTAEALGPKRIANESQLVEQDRGERKGYPGKGALKRGTEERSDVTWGVTREMSRRRENAHTPIEDSVFELRTRMARMMSIVEITSQRNDLVPELESILEHPRLKKLMRSERLRKIQWAAIKTRARARARDNIGGL